MADTAADAVEAVPLHRTFRGRAMIFVLAAALSMAYQVEKPYSWSVEETFVVKRNQFDAFAVATSTEWIAKFLPFTDSIQSVGKGEITKGKLYHSKANWPLYGEVTNVHKVVDFVPGKLFRLFGSSQWLRPMLTVKSKQKGNKTEVTIVVTFWRNSVLFQVTVAPFLWLIQQDALRQALILLQMDLTN